MRVLQKSDHAGAIVKKIVKANKKKFSFPITIKIIEKFDFLFNSNLDRKAIFRRRTIKIKITLPP